MFMDKKAISTLTLIILIGVSAIIGGIISYMLTIAHYVEMEYNIPEEETTLAITEILLDPEDVSSFAIKILNPSYSISNATITGIAISVEGENTLYSVVETSPDLKDGITVPIGKDVTVTCKKVQFEGKNVTFGRFITEHAGKAATVHVFSKEASAANKEFILPSAKLEVIPKFNVNLSVNNFTLIIRNEGQESLTINYIWVGGIDLTKENTGVDISQGILLSPNETLTLNCQESLPTMRGNIIMYTIEGYQFIEEFTAPFLQMFIRDVSFNGNETSSFSVTLNVTAFQTHTSYVNVTLVSLMLDNGTELTFNQSLGIRYNSTASLEIPWDWTEYRGREFNITVQTLQGLTAVKERVKTPGSVFLKVLNKEKTFDLKDREHFNLTILNYPYPSSLEAVNITKIEVKEKHVILRGNLTTPELPYAYLNPSEPLSINCTFNWEEYAGKNLTLIVYVITNATGEEYQFSFSFAIPKAELNITSVTCLKFGKINYLNITVENMPYSLSNLTISQFVVTVQNESALSNVSIVIMPGETVSIITTVQLGIESGTEVMIKVITEEGIEAQWTGIPSIP